MSPAATSEARSRDISPESFKVAIVGGGIGGLTTALALSTYTPGLNITVYEQAAAYREIGAGVGIGVNAGRVLDRLGVYKQANAISGARDGVHRSLRRWDNGEDIVTMTAVDEDKGPVRQLSVHRAEFLDVLLAEIHERRCATLETNMKLLRIEEADDQVRLKFANGTEVLADLVIACDGIHSTVRAQFTVDKPEYSGRIAYRGLLPLSAIATDWPYSSLAVSWLAKNKHFLVFPVSCNRTMNVVAFVTTPESTLGDLEESWTSLAPRSDLEKEYEGWDETVQKVIRSMDPTVAKWKLNDRRPLDQWTYLGGKVVMLGDAAHATLPHQGSGAGHAIESANILGLALRDYLKNSSPGLEAYTSLYQAVRLPRAQKAQITSREAGKVYQMQGPEFEGLDYEQCLPIVREKMEHRMQWVWSHDLEAEYNEMKRNRGLG